MQIQKYNQLSVMLQFIKPLRVVISTLIISSLAICTSIESNGSDMSLVIASYNEKTVYDLISDFTSEQITVESCKRASQDATVLISSIPDGNEKHRIKVFKDFVDFLVDGHTTMTHNEFSQLINMFRGHLVITTVYNRAELTIYELSIKGVKARVLYNKLQNEGISVRIISKRLSPFSASQHDIGADSSYCTFYASALLKDISLPIVDLKIITRSKKL